MEHAIYNLQGAVRSYYTSLRSFKPLKNVRCSLNSCHLNLSQCLLGSALFCSVENALMTIFRCGCALYVLVCKVKFQLQVVSYNV